MLRIFLCVLLLVGFCSCSTSIMKKRYSKGYTFFKHKNASGTALFRGSRSSSSVSVFTVTENSKSFVENKVVNSDAVLSVEKSPAVSLSGMKNKTLIAIKVQSNETTSQKPVNKASLKKSSQSKPAASAGAKAVVLMLILGLIAFLIFIVMVVYLFSGGSATIFTPGFWVLACLIGLILLLIIAKILSS